MTKMLELQGHLARTGSRTTGGSIRPAPVVRLGREWDNSLDSGTTELSGGTYRAALCTRVGAYLAAEQVVVRRGATLVRGAGSSFRGGMASSAHGR
jgi:hypothetical protein